jgi:hypothetical protein
MVLVTKAGRQEDYRTHRIEADDRSSDIRAVFIYGRGLAFSDQRNDVGVAGHANVEINVVRRGPVNASVIPPYK